MTLKSALQDFKQTTLSAISGLLAKLKYLASLRAAGGRYRHWGMESTHGRESAENALKAAHSEVLAGVLRTPLPSLVEDLEQTSSKNGVQPETYIEEMRKGFNNLLPDGQQNAPASSHLNSVLVALSKLVRNRVRATRSTS